MERINNQERRIISNEEIGQKLIVNNKPAVVVRSIFNDAVVAGKTDKKTIELMCYEGEEYNSLLLQRIREDGVLVCEYNGVREYVPDLSPTWKGNERYEHYNDQLKSHSPFTNVYVIGIVY